MQAFRSSASLRSALRSAPSASRAYSVAAPTGYASTNKNLRINGEPRLGLQRRAEAPAQSTIRPNTR